MGIIFAVSCALGWALGVWLPWWAIIAALVTISVSAFAGYFDGGLEVIPKISFTLLFCAAIILSGFVNGDVSAHDLAGAVMFIFTGN